MAKNWKAIAKHTGITVGEIGVMGASIILTKKFWMHVFYLKMQ